MIIKIISVPDGPAPIEVRKQWLNTEMPAVRLSAKGIEVDPLKVRAAGVDESYFSNVQHAEVFLDTFVPGANLGNRGGFKVQYNHAISALKHKSKEAAEWFEKNWPQGHNFSFGPDEVKIIQE